MSFGGKTATGQARVRCTILLNDGSRNKDTGKVCHLPVTIFADERQDKKIKTPRDSSQDKKIIIM